MKNLTLTKDYLKRSQNRLEAVCVLMDKGSYADVVRESQEIVELSLKALLRMSKIEVPRIHDVSQILKKEEGKIPQPAKTHLKKLCEISKNARRDQELSFYGSEDLTPSEFYEKEDAERAFEDARWVVKVCVDTYQETTHHLPNNAG